MEETRRSFLTNQILSGSKYLTINDKRYRLINPSKELRILAEHVYQETMDDLKFDSLITKEKCDLLLRGLNIWQPSDDEALKRLEKHLDDKKVDLFNALYNSERQITIRKAIATAKKGIEKAHARKHSLDYMTLHYHASITKRRFLVALCLQDETNKHVYNEGSFKTADSTLVEQAIVLLDQDTIRSIYMATAFKKWAIGFDLGGTNLRAALVSTEGKLKYRISHPTKSNRGQYYVIRDIKNIIKELLAKSPNKVLGVGIGAPGPLDPSTGTIVNSPNLKWQNVPLHHGYIHSSRIIKCRSRLYG